MEKPLKSEHLEGVQAEKDSPALDERGEIDIYDVNQNKRLNGRLDLRVLPLCCWVYLLNFLDRGIRALFMTSFLPC